MRPETLRVADRQPILPSQVVDACRRAAAAAARAGQAAAAIDAGLAELHDALGGAFVSAFVLEHERLWIVGSRGFSMMPDGISVQEGVTGRAVRLGRTQLAVDVSSDPDFIAVSPGIVSALALPLRSDEGIVGVVNVETNRPLPPEASRLVRGLGKALAPAAAELRSSRALDLSGIARLFIYMSSLRDPHSIAEVAVGSLPRVLPVETAQLWLADEAGTLEQIADWRAGKGSPEPLARKTVARLRGRGDPLAVFEVFDRAVPELTGTGVRSAVLIPLRANGEELGTLVGTSRRDEQLAHAQAELAALLGAHAAASLDAALSIGRERRSALTDPLTGLLNRRGFEEQLDRELAEAQEGRRPLSLLVLDCDDFKEVNDRAGHEFGDALLRELGDVLGGVLPDGACAARLGGDEFVVTLPGVEADDTDELAAVLRERLTRGLDEAGFPLHLSGGVSTYPYDGGTASQLLRAADQALYDAKTTGKDRVVGYRELVRRGAGISPAAVERRRGERLGANVLVEAGEAANAIWQETTVEGVLDRLCKALTFVVGAAGCVVSRVHGPYLTDTVCHALRDVDLGEEATYLIEDFPLTKEVLERGESRAISFLDEDLDRAEAFVLREMRMNGCLLVPLTVHGRPWALVELYEMRMRRYSRDDQVVADFLSGQAARRLETLEDGGPQRRRLPIFRLPSA